ncbi:neuropeptide receptor 15 [Patella vulgata]|uniref:neuropeptide receptor 15 n=1 Tax=Patella vulgata TaxID=6465 RepID=UPI0021804AC9|nr:neuropeptide receptor 15 [Patella vulgata]
MALNTSIENLTLNSSRNNTNIDSFPFNAAGLPEVIGFSVLFLVIGIIGIIGNILVIYTVISDKKMRSSATNLLITNLAFADLIIMIFGIPEIVQFMINKGWVMDLLSCKINRFILVSSLYASVFTLVSICIERYVGIIHPIKAYILCNRKRITIAIGLVWPLSCLLGTPTLAFNEIQPGRPKVTSLNFCVLSFPSYHETYYLVFKFSEFVVFYLGPLVVQVILYTIVSKHLFNRSEELHRRLHVLDDKGSAKEISSEAVQARRGVVKMLILSVIVYFVSYSPHQILLFYHAFRPRAFQDHWSIQVLVMIVAYINSAVNPLFYSVFSQNFRRGFKGVLCSRSHCNTSSRLPPNHAQCKFGKMTSVNTTEF